MPGVMVHTVEEKKKRTQAKPKAKRRVKIRESLEPARHFTLRHSFPIHLAATEIVKYAGMLAHLLRRRGCDSILTSLVDDYEERDKQTFLS